MVPSVSISAAIILETSSGQKRYYSTRMDEEAWTSTAHIHETRRHAQNFSERLDRISSRMPLCAPHTYKRVTYFPKPLWMRQVWGTVTGYGLLTVTGNEHKQMRKAMNPAFSLA